MKQARMKRQSLIRILFNSRRAKLEGITASTEEEVQESSDASESADSGMMGEEERQLWACIDMLVQSKTIVKNITAVS